MEGAPMIEGRKWSLLTLKFLNDVYRRRGTEIFSGTVPRREVTRRRAANKMARQSRRKNRG